MTRKMLGCKARPDGPHFGGGVSLRVRRIQDQRFRKGGGIWICVNEWRRLMRTVGGHWACPAGDR